MIKKISCCGCYFDKIYYILNSNHSINYETFKNGYDWVFRNLISGHITLICDNIFSQDSLSISDKLYEFNLST